jgi:hypothetical protein
LLKFNTKWLTLNQRVPGSSPGAPTKAFQIRERMTAAQGANRLQFVYSLFPSYGD